MPGRECLVSRRREIEPLVVRGDPAQRIVGAAVDVDCVVMATHGRSGRERALLGSVADRVIRHAPAPVLLVPEVPPAHTPVVSRTVVPLDGKPLAEVALALALGIRRQLAVPLRLIRVSPQPDPAAARYVDEVMWRHGNTMGVTAAVCTGRVVPALLAEIVADDLVFMATRGQHRFRRYLLGSVADGLVHARRAPVLLYRAAATDVGTAAPP